jgi:hypothetical protein
MEITLLIVLFIILQIFTIIFSYLSELADTISHFLLSIVMLVITCIALLVFAGEVVSNFYLSFWMHILMIGGTFLLFHWNYKLGLSLEFKMRLRYESIRDALRLIQN